ncbi:MAG: guanylate kinase [Phycisphaerales bacterium]
MGKDERVMNDGANVGDDAGARGRGLIVLSGPSGVGKTTVARAVERELNSVFSVSATTRPKTAVDVEGRDYFFLSEAEFQDKAERGEMLEHACVFGKHWYGTPRGPVEAALAAGHRVILEIDVQGARQIRDAMPDAVMVFIEPPSEAELLVRLRNRGREDEAVIQRRFAEARREIAFAHESGVYDAFVVNQTLEHAVAETIEAISTHLGQ